MKNTKDRLLNEEELKTIETVKNSENKLPEKINLFLRTSIKQDDENLKTSSFRDFPREWIMWNDIKNAILNLEEAKNSNSILVNQFNIALTSLSRKINDNGELNERKENTGRLLSDGEQKIVIYVIQSARKELKLAHEKYKDWIIADLNEKDAYRYNQTGKIRKFLENSIDDIRGIYSIRDSDFRDFKKEFPIWKEIWKITKEVDSGREDMDWFEVNMFKIANKLTDDGEVI